jgi:hypothetical protein
MGRGMLGDGAPPEAVDDITWRTSDVLTAFVGHTLVVPQGPRSNRSSPVIPLYEKSVTRGSGSQIVQSNVGERSIERPILHSERSRSRHPLSLCSWVAPRERVSDSERRSGGCRVWSQKFMDSMQRAAKQSDEGPPTRQITRCTVQVDEAWTPASALLLARPLVPHHHQPMIWLHRVHLTRV